MATSLMLLHAVAAASTDDRHHPTVPSWIASVAGEGPISIVVMGAKFGRRGGRGLSDLRLIMFPIE